MNTLSANSRNDILNTMKQLEFEIFDRNRIVKTSKIASLVDNIYFEITKLISKKDRLKIKLIDLNNFISSVKTEYDRTSREKTNDCLCDLKNFEIMSLKKIIEELTENYSTKLIEMDENEKKSKILIDEITDNFIKKCIELDENEKKFQKIIDQNSENYLKKCSEIDEITKKFTENEKTINFKHEEKFKELQMSLDDKEEMISSMKSTIIELQGQLEKSNTPLQNNDSKSENLKEILKKKEDTINELSSKVINLNNLLQRYVEMESRKTLIDPINFDYKLKHIKELNNDKEKHSHDNISQSKHSNELNDNILSNEYVKSCENLKSNEYIKSNENDKSNDYIKTNENDKLCNKEQYDEQLSNKVKSNSINNNEELKPSNNNDLKQLDNINNLNQKINELELKLNDLNDEYDILKGQNDTYQKILSTRYIMNVDEPYGFSLIQEANKIIEPKDNYIISLLNENENLKVKLKKMSVIEKNYHLLKKDFDNLTRDFKTKKENITNLTSTDLKLKLVDKEKELRDLNNQMFDIARENNQLKKELVEAKQFSHYYLEENNRLMKKKSEIDSKNLEPKNSLYNNYENYISNIRDSPELAKYHSSGKRVNNLKDSTKNLSNAGIYSILDGQTIIFYNFDMKLFQLLSFTDSCGFDQQYNKNGSILLNLFDGLLILSGKNNDYLFYYNSLRNTIYKVAKLLENHSNGGLIYYERDKTVFSLSGQYNKIVEKCSDFNLNSFNKVIHSSYLNEMKVERCDSPYIILNEIYLYTFFGYNNKTNRYLNTIERLNLLKQNQWELINYFNENLLATSRKSFATFKVNEEELLFIGGFSDDMPIDTFFTFNVKSSLFNQIEKKLPEIEINQYYDFQRNSNFVCYFERFYYNFDSKNDLHWIDIETMKYDVVKFY